ncbi:flavoprotein [Rhodococcus rhodnii]|uniref:flavoprotein n=1 Tax=Rhodococcus rhodnii TaxID=38312 RepID=UPI00147416F8
MAPLTPLCLQMLRATRPADEVWVALSAASRRFVTPDACAMHADRVVLDDWNQMGSGEHVELSRWPDAIIVYPASLNFVTRFSLGAVDTPAMLSIQCSAAPIVIAPALPPGGAESFSFGQAKTRLGEHARVQLLQTIVAPSVALGTDVRGAPVPFTDVIELLDQVGNHEGNHPRVGLG